MKMPRQIERQNFNNNNRIKIKESIDYNYYVDNRQVFINGYSPCKVYKVSRITGYLEAIHSCVIDDSFKEAFSEPVSLLNPKPEDYLKISRNIVEIIRIGDNDFCATKKFYNEDGSNSFTEISVHIRLINGKATMLNDNLGDYIVFAGIPGLLVLRELDNDENYSYYLYDVESARAISDKFSNIGDFVHKTVNGKDIWRATVTDIYSVQDYTDEAMFMIDEKGKITSPIYFISDNGDENKAIDTSNPLFNYQKFKIYKLKDIYQNRTSRYQKINELLYKWNNM
jgi:hypothetical protein